MLDFLFRSALLGDQNCVIFLPNILQRIKKGCVNCIDDYSINFYTYIYNHLNISIPGSSLVLLYKQLLAMAMCRVVHNAIARTRIRYYKSARLVQGAHCIGCD